MVERHEIEGHEPMQVIAKLQSYLKRIVKNYKRRHVHNQVGCAAFLFIIKIWNMHSCVILCIILYIKIAFILFCYLFLFYILHKNKSADTIQHRINILLNF